MATGIVYLMGAGPGDPGLILRRGGECIARADVVVYDGLAAPQLPDLGLPAVLLLSLPESKDEQESGACDPKSVVQEATRPIKRAGADIIITYHAKDAVSWLRE